MMIDAELHFATPDKMTDANGDVFIVETKSALGRGFADKCLRRIHARPPKKCSKYCFGKAVLGKVSRCNRFLPTMRQLPLVDSTALAAMPTAIQHTARRLSQPVRLKAAQNLPTRAAS